MSRMDRVVMRSLILVLLLALSGQSASRAARKKFISEQMCEKYAESVITWEEPAILLPGVEKERVDHCVVSETLIVGGELAVGKEFPHMALIGYQEGQKVFWGCGGTLISERWILSAAHCLREGPAKWAILGDLKVLEGGDDAEPITMEIVDRIVHPNYKENAVYNDIALFKLKNNVTLSGYIRPACLHRSHEIKTSEFIASGWGHTSWGGEPTQNLMKVFLPKVSADSCNKTYKSESRLKNGILDDTMICAGGIKGKDTCQGDSGGPLVVSLKTPYCMYSVVGITSFGAECAVGKAAIYTRVSYYAPWIESIVWGKN